MKNLLIFSVLILLLLLPFSCNKDRNSILPVSKEQSNFDNESITSRSYDEEECGFVPELCIKCILESAPNGEIFAFTQLGGSNTTIEGVYENYLRIIINGIKYTIHPAKFFEGESHEFVISNSSENYVTSDIQNEYVKSKATSTVVLPRALENLMRLNFDQFTKGELTSDMVKEIFGPDTKIIENKDGNITIQLLDDDKVANPSKLLLWDPCKGVTMPALVLKYKKVLGMDNPHTDAEQIIEHALNNCTPNGFNPKKECINSQCVVNNILSDPGISGSSHAPNYFKLNYLRSFLDLSKTEYEWLYSNGSSTNFAEITEIFDNITSSQDLTNCVNADCVRQLAAQEYVEHLVQNGSFNSLQDLLLVYAKAKCLNNPLLLEQLEDVQNSCFPAETTIADLNTLVSFCGNNPTNQELANFIGAQIEAELACEGQSWVANTQWFDDDFWEILFDLLKDIAPELIPGVDTALDLKNSIEAANNGNYYESATSFAMALISITPLDECKDFLKVYKVGRKAYKIFRLFDKLKVLDSGLAKGFKKVVMDRNKMEKHIFIAKHYLDNVVKKVGGEENLIFEIYKKIKEDGLEVLIPNSPDAKEFQIDIQGFLVTVRLTKANGEVRIGTCFIPQA